MSASPQKPLALWLFICCALIFVMVVLGGATRLTRSGLSIVEWAPILGAIPPLNEQQWQASFDQYKQTPEYQKVNLGMDLQEFKGIYWFEYSHRLLGRIIGLAFLLPFLYFLWRKRIQAALVARLLTLFVLGGLQGAMGWYMVKSGLVDNPHVSPYRLSIHLALAFLIYGLMLRMALNLLWPQPEHADHSDIRTLRPYSLMLLGLISIMVISGAFVAGLKAGFLYNTFPLMNGQWLPPGMFALDPFFINFFENLGTVQFNHRLLAYVVIIAISLFWLRAARLSLPRRARLAVNLLPWVLGIQVALGISTLLYVVPIPLAAAHQAGALLLFSVVVFIQHELRPRA